MEGAHHEGLRRWGGSLGCRRPEQSVGESEQTLGHNVSCDRTSSRQEETGLSNTQIKPTVTPGSLPALPKRLTFVEYTNKASVSSRSTSCPPIEAHIH